MPKKSVIFDHLQSSYSDVSFNSQTICLKGHVIFLYYKNKFSFTTTAKIVSETFGCQTTKNQIRHLINNSVIKYKKHISRDMSKFEKICSEVFSCAIVIEATNDFSSASNEAFVELSQQNVSAVVPIEEVQVEDPRGAYLTPIKAKLKQRLSLLSQSRSDERKKYREAIFNSKSKLKQMPIEVRLLKKNIWKKNIIIFNLRKKLKSIKVEAGQQNCKRLLLLLKRQRQKYQQLKKQNAEIIQLKQKLVINSQVIKSLEHQNLLLEEKINNLESNLMVSKKNKKTYNTELRTLVFDAVINQVSANCISSIIQSFSQHLGLTIKTVPCRNTVEQMVRELGVITDLQTAEIDISEENLTLGFDGTTQEGIHASCIHLTTKTGCHVVALDELSGGTSEDYEQHICQSIDNLAKTYASFHLKDFYECRQTIINNIANTISDRAVTNHATIKKLSLAWNKTFNELNCHLHPLETFSSRCRTALKVIKT